MRRMIILAVTMIAVLSFASFSKNKEQQVGSSMLVLKSAGKDAYSLYFGNEIALKIKLAPVEGKNFNLDVFSETEYPPSKDAIFEMIEMQPINGWRPLTLTSQFDHDIIFSKENRQISFGDVNWGTHGYYFTEHGSLVLIIQGICNFNLNGAVSGSIDKSYDLSYSGHLDRKLSLDSSDYMGVVGNIDDRGSVFGIDWNGFRKSIEKINLDIKLEQILGLNYEVKLDGNSLATLDYKPLKKKRDILKDYCMDGTAWEEAAFMGIIKIVPADGWKLEYDASTLPITARLTKGSVAVNFYGALSNKIHPGQAVDSFQVLVTSTHSLKILASQPVVGYKNKNVRQFVFINYYPYMAKLAMEAPAYSREVPEHPFRGDNYCKISENIKINFDKNKEEQLQKAVDEGHQPWRLDAVSVAAVYLATLNPDIAYEDCKLEDSYGPYSAVSCEKEKRYFVVLKRLVRPDGIWTVTSSEVSEK